MTSVTAHDIASAHPHSLSPDDVLAVAYGRRVHAVVEGRIVVDTQRSWVVWLPGLPPVPRWAFHEAEVDERWIAGLGEAAVDHVDTDAGRLVVLVDGDAADAWFEEDEQVHVHPRDPFGRVEVRASSRRAVVRVGDAVVADSRRLQLLYETGLPMRCYVPRIDVAVDALVPSDTRSVCPYKGVARHFHVVADGQRIEDGAWSYPLPRFDLPQIVDHVCFYDDRVTSVVVEGLEG